MIPLPDSLEVKRNTADERALLDSARAWLESEERAEGLHASGFLDPRQEFWRNAKPQPITDREVPIFLIGKVLHAFVLGSMAGNVNLSQTDAGSAFEEEIGFHYSPDWDKGEVAEFKTNRRFKEPTRNEDLDVYLEQLLMYMVAKKITTAKLWVLYINLRDGKTRKTSPEFRSYMVTVSEQDLEALRTHVKALANGIRQAIADGGEAYRALDLCRPWKCGRGNCPWYDDCRPEGRYGTPEFDGK